MQRPPAPVVIAIALPLLLALVVAGIAITVRVRGLDVTAPDTAPLAVAPVDAPQATDARCTALLAGLDGDLPAGGGTLPQRALAAPVQPGVRAWAAAPRPVVLRCGLPRPAELTPTSALLVVDGISWLRLDDGVDARSADAARGVPDPVTVTYVAVDRPVYVALTAPSSTGSGPLQQVSDVVGRTLPAVPVAVR